jgi:2-pyrone-4,6-dicarboxylate lactonase
MRVVFSTHHTLYPHPESARRARLEGWPLASCGDFPYAAVTPMARALVAHRPDRLVFDTDWPHVNMDGRNVPNDGDLVDLIPEWIEDAATQKQILVDNPRKLYGFTP